MMGHDFKKLSNEELLKKLDELNELLVDTEELREMQLGQTGQHIYSNLVTGYAQELAQINEDISTVKGLLGIVD